MFRMTTLKISLFSALATLFLLVSMLASTGTASAHTASAHTAASCQPQVNPACTPHPQLHVYGDKPLNWNCKWMAVVGSHFAPGPVKLQAKRVGFFQSPLSVNPSVVTANVYGGFFIGLNICSYNDFGGFGSPHVKATLVGIDSNGVQSNKVVV